MVTYILATFRFKLLNSFKMDSDMHSSFSLIKILISCLCSTGIGTLIVAKESFFEVKTVVSQALLPIVTSLPWPYRQMHSCIRQKGGRTSSKSPRR